MFKKVIGILTAVIVTVSMLVGCSAEKPAKSIPAAPKVENSQPIKEQQEFKEGNNPFEEIEDESKMPQEIKDAIEKYKMQRGFFSYKSDGALYVLITAGEKNTGGYDIKVKSVKCIEGTTKIVVEETEPAKGAMVIMAITYPYTVIRTQGVTDTFDIQNTKGDQFIPLSNIAGSTQPVGDTPQASKPYLAKGSRLPVTYLGQIDNNSIEIQVAKDVAFRGNDKPIAARLSEQVKKYFDGNEEDNLKEGEQIFIDYVNNEHGQMVIMAIKKVE